MCWNQHVSLNTFLFSGFVLLLIVYNNNYTPYKIKEINNIWMYLFITSIFSMQLIEFFLWRNVKDSYYNGMFTFLALLLVFIQPIASLMLLSNIKLRNILLTIYGLFSVIYYIYKFTNYKFESKISPLGHLIWNLNIEFIVFMCWIFFFLFSLFYEKKWIYFLFGFITVIAMIYKYTSDESVGSMWCWFENSFSIYLAAYLLFYLPYFESKELC